MNSESGERHPQLYFPDGDVVLRAPLLRSLDDKVEKHQLYRVHKAHLAHYSVMSANMFADGDAGLGPTYDGQPLVELSDEAESLSCLLTYFYNPFEPLCTRWDPNAPILLSPVIRLADKYVVEGLRASLIKRVVSDWPCTLAAWDASEGEANAILKHRVLSGTNTGRFVDQIPEPAAAIAFAREFGCTEILPAAFYQLCRINIKEDFEQTDHSYLKYKRLARWSLLDLENITRYLHGREELRTYCKYIRRAFDEGEPLFYGCIPYWAFPDCPWVVPEEEKDRSERPCYAFAERILQLAWPEDEECDPLDGLLRLLDYESLPEVKKGYPKGFCEKCGWEFGEWLRRNRQGLWNRLPQLFHL
ncbi:uncharacterized protein TRAVEDRAFT_50686 [Trametes versicolor FP-101664 SS1]|uniref:uncharacterized protein n=1 Tax=Trametes versicolor (strain FP-101664) TaxID=717944 RepID=UPI0004623F19|nr:uncharacterized protein TRAVEDRAFT_50686 [Trametes versicolor FP-101664 SS1]EIW56205.1 hypothetical protein TRAVEDRAFT_50686 [Trametes versicolor FP-101664 SS1]